ncbi:DUF4390 domain-containing protein [Ideonella sp. A 288]|uniref:DUF4390 domain-containing protein n=1 Tax=Ideonella sp. A 288 TaxID=1962181 RepID=UPI000B4B4A4E|nr:DUF4390 domain-containing protein [Ideonella sp. A 288]
MRRSLPHLSLLLLRAAARCLSVLVLLGAAFGARAQGVELTSLHAQRLDGALTLEYHARLTLTPAIEDALQRGVPLYFVAQAAVYRNRWYWRDERLARVTRNWRLSYQPLTSSWRVSLGGLSQNFGALPEAMAQLTRVSGWRLVEADRLEPGERYYVEFSFQIDRNQLPQPMQIDIGSDWKLGIERTLRLSDLAP